MLIAASPNINAFVQVVSGKSRDETTVKLKKEKTYACKRCLFVTFNKALLKEHKLIHNKEKIHKCNICDYGE